MKKCLTLLMACMISLFGFGESYSNLWKRVEQAQRKDLPKTEVEVLEKIVAKARKGHDYGQLLKAELLKAQAQAAIAPDSLMPAAQRLVAQSEATEDKVLKVVYQTVLYRLGMSNYDLHLNAEKPKLTDELCELLGRVKDKAYSPTVISEEDSRVFGNDLLSVVGYELGEFATLHSYYKKVGNRRAACLTAAQDYLPSNTLKALMEEYADLPEAGELAIAYYRRASMTTAEQTAFIRAAVSRWGTWRRMNVLRNELARLTNPQYQVAYDRRVNRPNREMTIRLEQLRNVKELTLSVYRLNADGDTKVNPEYPEGYKKMKPLIDEKVAEVVKPLAAHEPYEFFEDSLTLGGLGAGVYMLEFNGGELPPLRKLYFVTDVYTLVESQPSGVLRLAVVSATTGQPIAGAHLRIREQIGNRKYEEANVTANAQGEYLYTPKDRRRVDIFAYTDSDKAATELSSSNNYRSYSNDDQVERTELYADRTIYRPGQTVHVAALVYNVTEGYKHQVADGKRVTFTLRDANWKEVKQVVATTDAYGVCAVDLTLPAQALTGRFTIQANGRSLAIRVEEYKRPTFEVEFADVKQHYEAGDTVTVQGTARSYAGVPVQGARVKYKVERRVAFWWWNYWSYYDTGILGRSTGSEEITTGETETDGDGHFTVSMPLTMPESQSPQFYNFVVTADVTDAAGETHEGTLSLPLGNRKTALGIDLEEQVLAEDDPQITIHLRNAAGQDIEAEVKYRIDGGEWLTAKTKAVVPVSGLHLKSGSHTVEAQYGEDTVKRSFVVFSLDDEQPATETADWFWQSATQFPNDGTPVTLQVGSSMADVHIFYSIYTDNKVIESGTVDKSNGLVNRKFSYREEYGDGIVMTFVWVKDGHCYEHRAHIRRPLPDKHLQLEWTTFRDRLTPGQQEEWTLIVKGPDGKPAQASLMATLYDKSLDQLEIHDWLFWPHISIPLPDTEWKYPTWRSVRTIQQYDWHRLSEEGLTLSHFDQSLFRGWNRISFRGSGGIRLMKSARALGRSAEPEPPVLMEMAAPMPKYDAEMTSEVAYDVVGNDADAVEVLKAKDTINLPGADGQQAVQVRENLNETAFFYPQLTTDARGRVALKFTLPESLTTWRFMGLAHTQDLCYGLLTGEAVAQKDVMIQPNMPRFVREGDKATITARIFNIGQKKAEGTAVLWLIDPETDKVVLEQREKFDLQAGGSTTARFLVEPDGWQQSLLICQVTASGRGFSDGEQHYLPILPSRERVTVCTTFTQHEPGTKTVDLSSLIPADSKNGKLTLEYTNSPVWMMIQALPTVGKPSENNVISQAAAYYANSIGQYIINQNPKVKTAFDLWQQEQGSQNSLTSALEKNEELKDIVLNETPWVMDAERETEQKQRLADFFDRNIMQNRLLLALGKMSSMQGGDGSWSWWPGMPGSYYMTVAVSEMLVRLNAMTGENADTRNMLSKAFGFMGQETVEMVKRMKENEKKGYKPGFPSFKAMQWLYLCALDGRKLPDDVQAANNYLMPLLKKDIKSQSIYEKAMTAVILAKSEPKLAKEYVQSLKEYTVYREEMGRYYDTPRAGYSWYDYRIPTQTMAIEALQRLTPDDRQTIIEMQRWLLQSKRAQAWDTPINSVNAVYAFLNGSDQLKMVGKEQLSTIKTDGRPLPLPEATAAIGYVKTPIADTKAKTLTVEKTSEGTSWGSVYAQFTQATANIADFGTGITVKRELLTSKDASHLAVGDRVKVRITIEADRDLDFVQVLDKRAACLEPVEQLSGYHQGSYCTPRDYSTNFYFDLLSKGRHVIETEYYVDRPGTYETGTCTVQCAYAPEFRATTGSKTLVVEY